MPRSRSTGRKSSNLRDGAFVAGNGQHRGHHRRGDQHGAQGGRPAEQKSDRESCQTGNQPGNGEGGGAGDPDTGCMPGDSARLRRPLERVGNRLEARYVGPGPADAGEQDATAAPTRIRPRTAQTRNATTPLGRCRACRPVGPARDQSGPREPGPSRHRRRRKCRPATRPRFSTGSSGRCNPEAMPAGRRLRFAPASARRRLPSCIPGCRARTP